MSLPAGTTLGPYAIDAPLGAGGMGEVYRARDTRLGREVAVKVIAADSATDPGRLARFEQEARAAAALNHPNILAVFDIGPGGVAHGPYIVSELLDGETLGARLARGRLPVRTAIELATQVARALAAAHDKGIVHRDLKPDNIFVTRDGTAKVLDFGLAKLREMAPGASGDASTITGRPPTAQGAVMGTVGYMAPEQVRGADVDHRADIFAIGVTLYEMLSGQRAFRGDSGVETLNAILKSEPAEFEALGVPVPAEVARIVTHCLEKHPGDRFQSARDLAFHLAGAAGSAGDALRKAPAPDDAGSQLPRRRWALPVGLVAAALVGALVTGGALLSSRTEGTPDTTAFTIPGDRSGVPTAQGMALSPDGRTLAMTWTATDGTGQLLLRPFDDQAPRLVVGAGRPQVPFFSPDGRHVAYASGVAQQLMRAPVAGGPPAVITSLTGTRYGGVWLPDGRIIYANSRSPGLMAVPAGGGASEVVVPESTFDGASLRWPTATADGQVLVFQVGTRPPFRLGAYALATGQTAVLGPGSSPRFATDGLLLYAFDGELWAAEFERRRLQLGAGRRVGVSVATNAGGLATYAAVGDTLVALDAGSTMRQLVVYDRAGQRQVLTESPRPFFNNAVPSPDGTLIATTLNELPVASVVVFDTVRRQLSQANTSISVSNVEWAPGGGLLAYELGVSALRLIVPGREEVGPPLVTGVASQSFALTPQGDLIFLTAQGPSAQSVLRAPLSDPSKMVRLWSPAASAISMQLRPSPDGRTLATSEFGGTRVETFVRNLDDPERRVQVSVEGGEVVGWDRDGGEIYYFSAGAVWSAPVSVRPTLAVGRPSRLFEIAGDVSGAPSGVRLRVMPDGQHFLASEGPPSAGAQVLVVRHGLQRLLSVAAK